ncbi:MAG: methyltransferase family protein [Planctomycetota bacterium]|jgi:protein-S-isoprenylcysteine O-methyltransferase Ste14
MRRPLGKAGEWAAKVVGLFAVLEPVWMLLPFAGFLYGSVLNISLISRLRVVSRLAHFVLPVHTLFPTGLVLMGLGTLVFLAGAGQIYYAKLARRGLVTGGLYRFARHPQYTALVLFGAGALLTWGRLIAWIAFAGMMCLYYFLARKEERGCAEAFGDDYRAYAARTPFAFPGDRRLAKLVPARLPRWAGVCAVLVAWLCLGLVGQTVFGAFREVRFLAADAADVEDLERYILVRAPVRPAVSDEKFARRVLETALGSEAYLDELRSRVLGTSTALAFVTPGKGWRGAHDRANARVRLFTMLLRRNPGARDEDLVDPNEPGSRDVYTAFFLEFDLGRREAVGKAERRGPRPKPGRRAPWMFRSRMEERIAFFTSGL